jgi:hypothetical protein
MAVKKTSNQKNHFIMKKSILLFALCACIFAGCSKEEPQDMSGSDEYQVMVSLSTDFTQSMLKSEATDAEKTVNKVILFGVAEDGSYVATYTINHQPIAAEPITILRKVKTLYAIANPTAAIEGLASPNAATLDLLAGSFTGASPFLMGGKGTITKNGADYTVSIQLVRTAAKVAFASTNAELTITSVTVKNTPHQAYVFRQGITDEVEDGVAATPDPAGRSNDATVTGSAPIVYVAESVNNDAANTTTFTVAGTYDGKTASYDVVLKTGTNNQPIDRNRHYSVRLKPITESVCDVSVFDIPDWDDVDGGEYEMDFD